MRVVLAIDQGSSSTKVLALDERREVVARSRVPVSVHFPRPGWVELDPLALWHSTELAVTEALTQLPPGAEPAAVGVSNQRESAIAWDRDSGQPLGPGVSWQCQRGGEQVEQVRRLVGDDAVRRITGLPLDTAYTAPKLSWLLAQLPAVPPTAAVGTVDAWLAWQLTAGAVHACDAGNASRTGLYELARGCWSPELLAAYDIPPAALPQVVASSGILATCRAPAALAGVPLAGLCGDSHASLFSHYLGDPAAMKASYGTGSSVVALGTRLPPPGTREQAAPLPGRPSPLARSVLWQLEGRQLGVEGNVLASGSGLDWMAGLVGAGSFRRLEELAARAGGSGSVTVVPALTGLGAPWLVPAARAQITGLQLATEPGEVAHAAFEGVAHLVADVADAIAAETGEPRQLLHADGGGSRSSLLMQLQADLLGLPVECAEEAETSALGAAALAGLGVGLWTREELAYPLPATRYEPRLSRTERAERRGAWQAAVRRCAEQSP